MALTLTTELEAVNIVLTASKQKPVSSLADTSNEETSVAHQVLLEVSREVQEHGWYFNTEVNVQLALTTAGEIPVAPDVVHLDWSDGFVDPVVRGDRVFDRKNNTFIFSTAPKVVLTRLLDWSKLPQAARLLIARRAARIHAARSRGRAAINESLVSDEDQAMASLVAEETRAGDYNILDVFTRRRPSVLDRYFP